ncbi:MAG: hypothetical protein WCH98_17470, partial [Verrucomicrobiota bacterium]
SMLSTQAQIAFPAICACVLNMLPCLASEPGNITRRSAPALEEGEEKNLSASQIQSLVMDFSDQYASAIGAALDDYSSAEPDPAKRVAAQAWKVRYGSAAMAIAASRDPRTSLLDMTVFVSTGKWAVDSYWVPKVFGKKSARLSDAYERLNENIWRLAGRVLSLRQQADLRVLIKAWERQNPNMRGVPDIRLRNLDGVHLSAFDDGLAARGILAGVRKLLGRVDTSLLYGERMMFCLERTPRILSQQTDLTLAQIGEAFPIATVKPDAFANAIKDLPGMLQEGLDRNEGSLNTLLPQIGAALESANTLTASLDKTLLSVHELAEKTGDSGFLRSDPAALLKDANQALSHLDSSINGLNQLLEKSSAGDLNAAEITRQLDRQAGRLMDAAFRRILILIGVFFGGVALVLVLAKILFRRKEESGPASAD